MGSAVFDIAEVLGARGSTKAKKIRGGGTIFVHARKSEGSGVLRLKLKGEKLKNVEGLFSKSDPFFELSRKVDIAGGQSWDNVYRSEAIHNNLDPEWKEVVIDLGILCGGNLDLPILFSVFDHESSGKHKPMGELEVTVNGLVTTFQRNDALKLKQKGKDTGMIHVLKADVSGVDTIGNQMAGMSISAPVTVQKPATFVAPSAPSTSAPLDKSMFVDYISGGCKLNAIVAIDFTGSNGDPRKPGTLHYMNPAGRNDYEKAISAIVSILAKYDSDQMFPVYGFGAKYDGVVRHCFPCGNAAEHHGVAGVLEAYKKVFKSGLTMSAPTVFTDVIRTAAQHAEKAQEEAMRKGGQCYSVLLIVTDGAVSDVQATARCLEEASQAPLSVIIVGVGNADFSAMRFLDDLSVPGKRDIAQFVEFNQHSHSSESLASETLNEVPAQLVGYFQSKGIQPLAAIQRSDSTVTLDTNSEEDEIDLNLNIGEDEIVITSGGDDFVDGFNASH